MCDVLKKIEKAKSKIVIMFAVLNNLQKATITLYQKIV